jgi:hypothetical protein
MIVINNIDNQRFTFNGVEYFKNFTPIVVGNKIKIVNTYDSNIELTDYPSLFSDYSLDGVVYANVNLLQSALLPVIYTRDTLGVPSGIGIDTAMSDTSTNAVQNKVIKAYADTKWSKEVVEVDRYENIPLEAGYYSTIKRDNVLGYDLQMNVNAYYLEDDSNVGFSFYTESYSSKTYIIVKRELLADFATLEDEEPPNPVFVDSFYGYNGDFLGSVRPQDAEPVFILSEKVVESYSYFIENFYVSNFLESNSKSFGYKTAYLKTELSSENYNNGLITFDYDFGSDLRILHSDIFVNSNELSNCKIGLIESETKNNLGVLDFSGYLENTKNLAIINARISYANVTTNKIPRITPFLNNTRANVVNLETLVVHSDAMVLTFNEVNTGFSGTMFDANSSNISDFSSETYQNNIANNNVDLLFSAGSGMSFLKNNVIKNSYSVIPIGSNNLTRIDLTDAIDKFPPNYISVTSRSETDNTGTDPLGTSYGFGTEFNEPTLSADLTGQGLTDWAGSTEHQQSPATAIVAGKLKKIKDDTGATWDVVRESARRSASNYGSYNIYRGFGVIDVALAITLVPTVESERSLELAEYWKNVTPFNQNLKFEDKSDYTPVVKKDLKDTKSYLSGRIGDAMTNPEGEVILKFNEFWASNNTITHDVTTGKFTFSKSGKYRITFNGINNYTSTRLLIGKNELTPGNTSNFGQTQNRITFTPISLNVVISILSGDYIIFRLLSGIIYNADTNRSGEFSIEKID